MANKLGIKEVTLAQISNKDSDINVAAKFGELMDASNATGTGSAHIHKATRTSVYDPMVVRVTDHVANTISHVDKDTDKMALFLSARHGEPWVMVGHQTQHLIHPAPGVTNAPIESGKDYSIIYPNLDYSKFK